MTKMTYSETRMLFNKLAMCCLIAIAAFLIFLPPENGISVAISPDSLEYTICLDNLFRHGRFGFTLNGEWYPSRYSPWFSLICLTPAYLASGGNSLCCHLAIIAYALVLLVAVWRGGCNLGLGKLAVIPPFLLMFMPDFLFYSRVVLTEIPYTAVFAVIALLFVRFARLDVPSVSFCWWIGVLVAMAGLVRSTGFSMVAPFAVAILIRQIKLGRKLLLVFVLVGPTVLAVLMGLVYNWLIFDNPFRSGYLYWNAVPLDFPSLTFNLSYVPPAVSHYLHQPIIQLTLVFIAVPLFLTVLAACFGELSRYRNLLLFEVFLIVQAIVLIILYIGYYWVDVRFFLPISFLSVLLFIAAVFHFLKRVGHRLILLVSLTVIVFSSFFFELRASPRWISLTAAGPVWLASALKTAEVVPAGSVVLQSGDPNLLDHFAFRDKQLQLYPLNRRFNYLIQMTSPSSISKLCQPKTCWQFVVPELVDSGVCGSPFPSTFIEDREKVLQYVSAGRRVFVVRDSACYNYEFEHIVSCIEGMGMSLKLFKECNVKGIEPNPIRHLYDRLLFPCYSMDSCPDFKVAYYEIVADTNTVRTGM